MRSNGKKFKFSVMDGTNKKIMKPVNPLKKETSVLETNEYNKRK